MTTTLADEIAFVRKLGIRASSKLKKLAKLHERRQALQDEMEQVRREAVASPLMSVRANAKEHIARMQTECDRTDATYEKLFDQLMKE